MSDDIFGEIISYYTDSQALEDGVLVDISSLKVELAGKIINRMTRNLWDKLQPFITNENIPDDKPMVTLRNTLKTKVRMARRTKDDYMYILPPNLWAVENETGGYTIMLPEDY